MNQLKKMNKLKGKVKIWIQKKVKKKNLQHFYKEWEICFLWDVVVQVNVEYNLIDKL